MTDFDGAGQAFVAWLQRSGAEINPKIKLEDLRNTQAGRGVGKLPFSGTGGDQSTYGHKEPAVQSSKEVVY